MGTITERERKDGTTGHYAQILIKRKGRVVHREAQTFDRKQAAKAWLARRETELAQPGALERGPDPKLHEAIDRSIAETEREMGDTKTQVLRTIKKHDIAEMRCSEIKSHHISDFIRSLKVLPQTRLSYASHLSSVFTVAKPLWGYPLDAKEMESAMIAMRKLGIIAKGDSRDRRPTLEELNRLMNHFARIKANRPKSMPMTMIILFAIFATRRQEEITRVTWVDYDKDRARQWVRDMKHPGDKQGNDVLCDIPERAIAIIESMPRTHAEIFPYSAESISAAFTRACLLLGIEDLHFHDLRHEGISHLFEMRKQIPEVAKISGHRTWTSLKRYTHVDQYVDKYAGWKWLEILTNSRAITVDAEIRVGNDVTPPAIEAPAVPALTEGQATDDAHASVH